MHVVVDRGASYLIVSDHIIVKRVPVFGDNTAFPPTQDFNQNSSLCRFYYSAHSCQ